MKTLSLFVTLLALFGAVSCIGGKGVCVPQLPNDNRINGSYITNIGRFGNQLFYYIFLKTYAKRHGLTVELPEWPGKKLFGLNDPEVELNFCKLNETDELIQSYKKTNDKVFVNRDFYGYFQLQTSIYIDEKDYIRQLFTPTEEVRRQLQPAVDQIRSRGKTLIAIHLRRGDTGWGQFVTSPAQWYLDWLRDNWNTLEDPVLFLASDSLDAVLPEFEAYHPITSRDLDIKLSVPKAGFYPDFYLLTQADILLISNSTFSTSAALLNKTATKFLRPEFDKKVMVEFDPWNTYPWESWHKVE